MSLSGTPVDIPLHTGFTAQHPVTTSISYPGVFTLNHFTGNINFTPTQQEIDVLAVLIEEFRYDSVLNVYAKIGSSNRDMMVLISSTCNAVAQQGVTVDFTAPNLSLDSITGLAMLDAYCNDSSFNISFSSKLDCASVSPDGTDFLLVSATTQQPLPILNTVVVCDPNGETSEIIINLMNPLTADGNYYLTTKMGLDGNAILNKCGFSTTISDTIVLRVTGCSGVNINELNATHFKIYPNPASKTLTIKNLNLEIETQALIIYDNSGKQVYKTDLSRNNKSLKINIENFENGFYIVELKTNAGAFYHRFIKM